MSKQNWIVAVVAACVLGVGALAALEIPSLRIAFRAFAVLGVVLSIAWVVVGAIGADLRRTAKDAAEKLSNKE